MGLSIQCNNIQLLAGPPATGLQNDHMIMVNPAGAVSYWKCNGGSETLITTGADFDPSTLDPLLIAGAVGAGFFLLIPLWAAIYGGKKLLDIIN